MLAIVIPYFKLNFFEATLQSLAEQTDNRFTVYVGDDYSPATPSTVLGKYKHKIKFQYTRFSENYGSVSLVKQWHRCLEMVGNEEWVIFLGDDDVLQNNVVASFYNQLSDFNHQVDVVRFSTCKIDALGHITSKQFTHPPLESATDFLFRNVRSSLSEYVFRKSAVQKIGFKDFPLGWCSDILAVIEFSGFKNVYSINHSIVFVRISSKSISGSANFQNQKNKAAFSFLYYLLNRKYEFFNSFQKNELQNQIINLYLNNKKNIVFFFLLSWYFIRFLMIIRFLKFLHMIFLSFKNKVTEQYV